jgi:hypothetical protein
VLAFPRLVLVVGGTTVLICGVLLAALGLVAGAWIRSLLPEVVIDARAVGGATFALGVFLAAAGAVQLAVAAAVRRAERWVMAGGAVLAGILGSLLVVCAVAAVTEVGRGGTPWLLAAALALAVASIAYGAVAWQLSRASADIPREPQ